MLRVAMRMLVADRAKFAGLLFGLAFTSFLVTFAAAYFCGFMTRGFALVSDNPQVDVWVMDPAVESPEQTINLPDSALARVRGVDGVAWAMPLALGTVEVRLAQGRFLSFQVVAVDVASLVGAPGVAGAGSLRALDTVVAAAGGTEGKLLTPIASADQWPRDAPHLDARTRELAAGDTLLANGVLLHVLARDDARVRFPPRPLLYATLANARRLLPAERHRLTFVLAHAHAGIDPRALAARITARTGLRARSRADVEADTVRGFRVHSEDVGDIGAMLILAMTMGLGVTGIMLFLFTHEHLRQYAVLKAMGAPAGSLLRLVVAQAAVGAALGTGLGLGVCALAGQVVVGLGFPFRMMWFTPLLGLLAVVLVSIAASAASVRPVLKLQPGVVFAGR
jgi:putative ABC transport system permease protein